MEIKIGNIFDSRSKTLVNTVNCVGVMGKGIALEFKKRYPAMYKEYVALCQDGFVRPGVPYYYEDLYGTSILNFPTKDHWRSPSKLSYVVDGLKWFVEHYQEYNITSIAFPPLGCGNGGLSWEDVGPIMYQMLKNLPINIEIYAPYGTPSEQLSIAFLDNRQSSSSEDIVGVQNRSFNKYWLLILYVIQKLNNDRYSLNVGRTIFQKVCYILTRVGIPTGFHFVEGTYGPYSKEVNTAVAALSNANYMREQQLGKMVETVVVPGFCLPEGVFTAQEIARADKAFDLLSRIKSTEQAELIATVLFSYDEILCAGCPTERQIYNHVMNWKPHWKAEKEIAVITAISDLASLGWISPTVGHDPLLYDEDALY